VPQIGVLSHALCLWLLQLSLPLCPLAACQRWWPFRSFEDQLTLCENFPDFIIQIFLQRNQLT
jgi:hypothetical protein